MQLDLLLLFLLSRCFKTNVANELICNMYKTVWWKSEIKKKTFCQAMKWKRIKIEKKLERAGMCSAYKTFPVQSNSKLKTRPKMLTDKQCLYSNMFIGVSQRDQIICTFTRWFGIFFIIFFSFLSICSVCRAGSLWWQQQHAAFYAHRIHFIAHSIFLLLFF